jgi:ribosome recycling factor
MLNEMVKNLETNMHKAIEAFKTELGKLRTGRANTSLVEGVKVDYYGNETPLKNVASITISDARTIVITPWEKPLVKAIEKAITSANLGLNPVSDVNLIRIPIPPLTEERRKELTKIVKNIAENSKVSIRNIRREAMDKLKDLLKKKEIDEDMDRRTQDTVQKATDKFIAEIDKLVEAKEKDLMTV